MPTRPTPPGDGVRDSPSTGGLAFYSTKSTSIIHNRIHKLVDEGIKVLWRVRKTVLLRQSTQFLRQSLCRRPFKPGHQYRNDLAMGVHRVRYLATQPVSGILAAIQAPERKNDEKVLRVFDAAEELLGKGSWFKHVHIQEDSKPLVVQSLFE